MFRSQSGFDLRWHEHGESFVGEQFSFPSKYAFCACGILGKLHIITQRTALWGRKWCLAEQKNGINNFLVDRKKILCPLLHIRLGFIKLFTKALDKDSGCFTYLCQAFPEVTIEKLKVGIFDDPQIPQLTDPEFENSMKEREQEA